MAQGGWFRDVALRGIDFGAGRWHRRGIEGRPDVVARRGAAAAAVVTRKYTLRPPAFQLPPRLCPPLLPPLPAPIPHSGAEGRRV